MSAVERLRAEAAARRADVAGRVDTSEQAMQTSLDKVLVRAAASGTTAVGAAAVLPNATTPAPPAAGPGRAPFLAALAVLVGLGVLVAAVATSDRSDDTLVSEAAPIETVDAPSTSGFPVTPTSADVAETLLSTTTVEPTTSTAPSTNALPTPTTTPPTVAPAPSTAPPTVATAPRTTVVQVIEPTTIPTRTPPRPPPEEFDVCETNSPFHSEPAASTVIFDPEGEWYPIQTLGIQEFDADGSGRSMVGADLDDRTRGWVFVDSLRGPCENLGG